MIDEADKAGYKLYVEENANGEIDPFMSYQNLFLKRFDEGNTEILFARPSSDYGSYEKHATPAASVGSGGLGVTQSLVDAFFMQDGLPYDGSNEEGFSESDVKLDNTIWDEEVNGGAVTYAGTYNMYCNREPRFYTAVSYNGSWYALAGRKFEFFKNQRDNDYTHDAPQNGYLVRKKVYPQDSPKNGSYKWRQMFLYRLAASYLRPTIIEHLVRMH